MDPLIKLILSGTEIRCFGAYPVVDFVNAAKGGLSTGARSGDPGPNTFRDQKNTPGWTGEIPDFIDLDPLPQTYATWIF